MGNGYVIVDPRGKVIRHASRWGSLGTKAEAAYLAAGEGLIEAEAADATRVELYTDSEVVFRQLNGEFDGTNPNLRDLHRWVLSWLRSFKRGRCVYLGREESGQAERLASAAFD
jgi:ribonuclease HI